MTDTMFAIHANHTLLSVEQVADFLNVSHVTVYRLIEQGLLRAFRVARRLRFSRQELERYLSDVKSPDPYGHP